MWQDSWELGALHSLPRKLDTGEQFTWYTSHMYSGSQEARVQRGRLAIKKQQISTRVLRTHSMMSAKMT